MDKKNKGSIEIILGCMYSGKTTEVIRLCKHWGSVYQNVICINYIDDIRYGDDENLYSHDLTKVNCIRVKNLSDIQFDIINTADIILINEAQFFVDLLDTCVLWADKYLKKIIVSGLDGDFKRQPFGDLLKLIPYADNVTKLNALCSFCKDGTQAIFTFRTSDEQDQILIGANSKYIALCRQHYCEFEDKKKQK